MAGLGISIVSIDVISSYRDFNSQANQMRADFIARQKEIIKQEVDRVVDMIRYEKAQTEILTRRKIKSRVYEALSIAQNIYQQNQTTESKAKIQQMILDALRPIRFENGIGYYFATRLDGIEVLFADRPQIEGSNLLNMQDTRGQYVIKDMIEIAKQSGEGFYEYYWTKPESAGNDFKKISFIKLFEPYDWFIGTGLYVDDVESQIKADLLPTISRIRFGKEGYIFVNKLNGDALVSNGKVFSGTQKLWEIFNDNPEKMKDIFEKEYHAALTPEGDYIYYSWIKLTTSDKESPKTSFIYGILDLQWLVGAGVYLDDVETNIALMQTELNNQIKDKMLYYTLIIIAIFAVFFLFYNWLNQGFKKDFNLFISFFNRVAHSDEEIDRANIKFVEFDQIAEYANKMLTDRKRSEAEIRESEERFRAIFERSAIGKSLTAPDGKLLRVNKAFADMLGYEIEEVQQLDLAQITHPDDMTKSLECIQTLLAGEQASYRMEKRYIHKSGAIVWADVSTTLLHNEQGTPLYLITSIVDVTERKQADEEKMKLQTQLLQAQKMESVGRLAGGVAHDFNNMLGVILGHTELAMDQVDPDSTIHADLDEIRNATNRSADLTRQLLAFARKQTISPKVLDLNDTIENILKMLRRLIGENIGLDWLPGKSLWPIEMDPSQIDQILANLCVNARDAIDGDGKVLISTGNGTLDEIYCANNPGSVPGEYVELTVCDDGCGMDWEIQDNIFEPFFTTKEMGKGTGLGLATVYGIVKQNNGFIKVYSEPGMGTTFKIYLIRHRGKAGGQLREELPAEPIAQGDETILLVEDDPSILNMTTIMLKHLGYTVLAASTPDEAIRLTEAHPEEMHLLMTDVIMPKMNGRDLAGKLQSLSPNLKILFMSGYTANVIAHHGVIDPGVHFIQKPFSMRDLAAKVRKVLGNANA